MTGFTFGASMMKEKSRVFDIVSTRISKSWHVESESVLGLGFRLRQSASALKALYSLILLQVAQANED
jgi:hypothetical protein